MSNKTGVYWTDTLTPNMKKFFKRVNKTVHPKAAGATALQLINWTVNGSANVSVVPPILEGVLRGSGAVFFENKFIGGVADYDARKRPKTYSGKKNEITIVFNTAYAARWHENDFQPGPKSSRDKDVGSKYVEKHLKGDGKDLLAFYAVIFKREAYKPL